MKTKITLFALLFVFITNAQVNPTLLNNNLANYEIYTYGVAYYNGQIIFPDIDNNRIMITSATVTNAPVTILISNVLFPTGLKVVGDDLYFLQGITTVNPTNNSGKLSKINLTQTNPTVVDVLTGLNIPLLIDGNANEMYISEMIGTFNNNDIEDFDFLSQQISKINLIGTPNKTVVFSNREFIDDLKMNGTDVYWSEYFENDLQEKIIKYNTTQIPATAVDFYYSTISPYDGENFCIGNNMLYFTANEASGGNKIKAINLNQNPIVVQDITNPFMYNSQNTYVDSMVFNNNSIFASSAYYDSDTTEERTLLYKVDLNALSTQNQSINNETIMFFPNPTTSNISFTQEINNLVIHDITGKKVKVFENSNTVFDVADLEKGIYLLKGKTVEGNDFNEKLIKQ